MTKSLPAWLFLTISLVLMGVAQLPLLRVAIGIDQTISIPFTTTVIIMIGGLMSGLTAMILLVRRANMHPKATNAAQRDNLKTRLFIAASGFLLYSGIPLLNFLVVYWLWIRHRHECDTIDLWGRDVLNFQITLYLYLLLSLFMVFAIIGIMTTPIILLLHLICTILSILFTLNGKSFHFPANIPIIQGR